MREQVNLLRQIQELVLTRDEHHQLGDGSHLDDLNDSIAALKEKLDPVMAGFFDRLYKKSHIVVVPMVKNACSVCGMQVPIALVQQVMHGAKPVTCASCGRLLFSNDGDATSSREKADRNDPPKGISRFSCEELMITELPSGPYETAIIAMAMQMERQKFIANAQSFVSAVFNRENVLPTTMGNGIAFPHARGVEGGGLTFALGISKEGIDWAGEKAHVVVLSAIPLAASAFYLRLIAGLSSALGNPDNLAALQAAGSAGELWKTLVKATRATVK